MRLPNKIDLSIGVLLLVVAGAAWLYTGGQDIAPGVVLSARMPASESAAPYPPTAPTAPAAASPVALPQRDSPDNVLLIGTATEPGRESATFLIDGQTLTLALRARMPGSVLVVQRIGPTSVWMGDESGASPFEVQVRSAKEAMAAVKAARLSVAVPPDYGGRALPAGQGVVVRGEDGVIPPAEQQVRVRPRQVQKSGPVGQE